MGKNTSLWGENCTAITEGTVYGEGYHRLRGMATACFQETGYGQLCGHAVGAARLGPPLCLYERSRLKGWRTCKDLSATHRICALYSTSAKCKHIDTHHPLPPYIHAFWILASVTSPPEIGPVLQSTLAQMQNLANIYTYSWFVSPTSSPHPALSFTICVCACVYIHRYICVYTCWISKNIYFLGRPRFYFT